jgi:phage/plasmid-like protein (TIGR03299 family)
MTATTTAVDVNEAFKAERLTQIAAIRAFNDGIPKRAEAAREAADKMRAETEQRIADGKLTPLGNDSYRVTDPASWDNGEVWTMRQPAGIEIPLLLPVSNLDESRGSAALYTREPAWHGLGNVVPEGVSDLDEVLRLGGIDFSVELRPVKYHVPGETAKSKPVLVEAPGQFVSVRDDTYAPLGVVGSIYTPIQNSDAGAFLQDLVNDHNVVFESAGATYGGKHVFICLKLPEDITLELPDGVQDIIEPKIMWRNGHDGATSASMCITPWRPVCGNTERFALRDAVTTWKVRHTRNAMDRVNEARKALGLTVKYFDKFKAEEESLARTEVLMKEFEGIVDEIFAVKDDAGKRTLKNADARKETLTGMYAAEGARLGWSGYAAERAFTDYLDNVVAHKGDLRATFPVEGYDDAVKTRVHKRLMLKVR